MIERSDLYQATFADLERELETTRRLLERVPDGHFGWKPHERSRTVGELAGHIAFLPALMHIVLTTESYDVAPQATPRDLPGDGAALLHKFDENAARLRDVVAQTDDDALRSAWTLRKDGATVFTIPRFIAVRTMGVSHTAHHRGQLCVYLRLLGVPLPSIYGPTADEA